MQQKHGVDQGTACLADAFVPGFEVMSEMLACLSQATTALATVDEAEFQFGGEVAVLLFQGFGEAELASEPSLQAVQKLMPRAAAVLLSQQGDGFVHGEAGSEQLA